MGKTVEEFMRMRFPKNGNEDGEDSLENGCWLKDYAL
jgi:hypothetical protein